MEIRNLGRSGLRVSVVGLGCNNFGGRIDTAATRRVCDAAIDHGITLFDTADVYGNRGGSESALGEVLGDKRKKIVLATKFGFDMDDAGVKRGGSRRYLLEAVEASLRRLKTDWIDLYQMHRFDPATPIEETLRTLDDLVRAGKVRYIGCSNYLAWRVVEAQWTAKSRGLPAFACAQDELSLLVRGQERDLLPALNEYGLGLLPYFPLACGMLTGKYRRDQPFPAGARITETQSHQARYFTDANWAKTETLIEWARARGHTILELAFSWLAAKAPVASIIAGATKPEQIAANAAAASWKLTAEEIAEIETIAPIEGKGGVV